MVKRCSRKPCNMIYVKLRAKPNQGLHKPVGCMCWCQLAAYVAASVANLA
ncbi:hypothetical protein WN55_02577 [Dufourea novaeangliae]|uniref:Uncharacterized protein n=1 Tax=Dufourea novaeangliae TaxID=178035 RepID=A0A154PHN9_DUFNO|nr:hypothetical protein WN55_02577 [Dufourea novaeangliae]